MSRQLTICVVGCGSIADDHIAVLARMPSARVTAVVSRNARRAERARRAAGAGRRFSSLDDALTRGDFQACVLCTPNYTHYDLSKAILRAGRHLLLEKPMALQLRRSRQLVRLASERELVLMVAQTLRFMPAFVKARQLIASGRLGRVLMISDRWMLSRRAARNWRGRAIDISHSRKDSLIFHHGSHTVDLARALTGAEVANVSAASATATKAITDDSDLAIVMTMSDGTVVCLAHSFSATVPDRSTIITGEKNTLRIDESRRLQLGGNVLIDETFDAAFAEGVYRQDRAFVRAARSGEEPPACGADVCRTMEVLEKIRRQTHSRPPHHRHPLV